MGIGHGPSDKSEHVILISIDCQPLECFNSGAMLFKPKGIMGDGEILYQSMKLVTKFEGSSSTPSTISLCVKFQ